jgi:hypothetical protein
VSVVAVMEVSECFLKSGCRSTVCWKNNLSEGNMLVHAFVVSYLPCTVVHVHVSNVVGFQVVDMSGVNQTGLISGCNFLRKTGAPGAIPTRDLPLRKTLYAELAHSWEAMLNSSYVSTASLVLTGVLSLFRSKGQPSHNSELNLLT